MAQVNGLLDWIQTPAGMGLLSGIASYAMNARRGEPVNNLGRGFVGGLAGYTGAKDQINKESDNALTRQYKQMQMQELESKIAQHKARQEWKAQLPQVMDQAKDKVTPFEADNPFGEDLGNLANVQEGNPQAMQEYMMRPESPYADDLIKQQYVPKAPKWNVVERYNDQTGMPEKVLMDENNPSDIRPFGGAQADTIVADNLGGSLVYRGSRSATPLGEMQRTISPDSELSATTARRGQDISRANAAAARAVQIRGQDMQNTAGKPPTGYRFTQGGSLEAIPGGPADIKAGELGAKQVKQKELSIAQAGSVLREIKDAQKLVGYSTVGVGGALRGLPMTPARDLDAKLTSIKANLGFDRLQQMRDASPTGGALGQVAVQELVALQSTVASLDQLQSPEQMRAALKKIETHYTNWQKTLQGDKQPAPKGGGAKFLGFE